MKNKGLWWIILIIVVVGAYYYFGQQEAPAPADVEIEQSAEDTAETEEGTEGDTIINEEGDLELGSEDFTLSASASGDGVVAFNWGIAEEHEASRFILVRDDEINPEFNGINYWYRINGTRREAVWANQPVGTQHYRLCVAIDEEGSKCEVYSNDVEVEVK